MLIMFSEVVPSIELYDNDDSNKESVDIPFVGNILGSEFESYVNLPPIDTTFEIEVGTRFHSMPIAVHFIEQFALQRNFAIYKHKSEKFSDGSCRKRVFKCDLGGKYSERLSHPTLGKKKIREVKNRVVCGKLI